MSASPTVTRIRDSDVTCMVTNPPGTSINTYVTGGTLAISLDVGDISIGAVEIKDGATDTRAFVSTAGVATSGATNVLYVQNVDKSGATMSASTQSSMDTSLSAIRMSGTRAEGLLGVTNSDLESIKTNTAGIPSDEESIRMSGTRVQGLLSTGNSSLSTIQTNTSDLSAIRMSGTRVEGIESALLTSVQSGLGVKMAVVSSEFMKSSGVTAYSINDVVGEGTVSTFTNVGAKVGGSGYITNVRLVKSTNVTTNALFRLWLYSTNPTAIADNGVFTLLWANRDKRLGYVDLVCTTEGAGSSSAAALATNVNLKFNCDAASRDIGGVLEAKQAYTPGSSEQFWIELTVDQN